MESKVLTSLWALGERMSLASSGKCSLGIHCATKRLKREASGVHCERRFVLIISWHIDSPLRQESSVTPSGGGDGWLCLLKPTALRGGEQRGTGSTHGISSPAGWQVMVLLGCRVERE